MKRFIALKAKQKEVVRYCAMQAKVNTLNHTSYGEKVGTTSKLVKLLTFGETLLLFFVQFSYCVTICSAKKPFFFVVQNLNLVMCIRK